jgi:exonuclease SbcD
MHRFAHMADCHIGAFRDPVLRELSLKAFEKALNICVEEDIDFIVISGDLFHSNIPDMGVVNRAVVKMKELRDAGINIYVIYGSHDFSPNETSIVDILSSAGLFQKIVKGEVVGEKIHLEFFKDPKTGAKLTGISGRLLGLEREYFTRIDRQSLEEEPGFKIFAFHTALDELKPASLAEMESMPLSNLPEGFDYYAGGHVHKRIEDSYRGYGTIRYPGTLFGFGFRDLEQSARGEKTGFYIVTFEDDVKDVQFKEVSVCEYLIFEYDVSDKNSAVANEDLIEKIKELPVEKKIVLVKLKGELSGGKTSDIDFARLRDLLHQNGAIYTSINRYALTSKEYTGIRVEGRDIREIEQKFLRENIGEVKVSDSNLVGEEGFQTAVNLLDRLRHEKKPNEKVKDYDDRMIREAIQTLELEEAMK